MPNPAGAAPASCAIDSTGEIKTKAARRFKNLDMVFSGRKKNVGIMLEREIVNTTRIYTDKVTNREEWHNGTGALVRGQICP